ncbi:MAG: FAD-binding oxidoreductase [Spirochaetes bacterium]|nr:MAG: FAD-binding oxidoreductase [Spirochaetota bacterium]
MSGKWKGFMPDWRETAPLPGSYRSIFKWGDPLGFKHPNEKLYREMKEIFGLTDEDFRARRFEGDEQVKLSRKPGLRASHVEAIARVVGKENVSARDYDRLRFASGKTVEEAMQLRQGKPDRPADLVVHPRHKEDVRNLVNYCGKHRIPVYVYGGGSSVNFGLRAAKGGVTLVLSTHMNKIVRLNEENQAVTVQAGILGPALEGALNDAPARFGSVRRYTCGHFPQSFEYSSAGGWVATLGSGQSSTYYGDAYDLVISQEYVTPAGSFRTLEYPGTATGPKVNDIMKGSEGAFGVLVELTLKVYRHMPENRTRFGYIFPTWEAAVAASREVAQGEFGKPAVFRISDQEETHIGLKLYGIDGTFLDRLMRLRGFKPMQRCLMLGSSEGDASFTKNVKRNVKRVCAGFGGMYLSGLPVKLWEPGRFKDPYLREDLQDFGILIDTLETGVTWDVLHRVHREVRAAVKRRPKVICMTHASHFYPQGTNLYFIFIAKIADVKEYVRFQDEIVSAICASGGSVSHHHGVGRMLAPWMEGHLGREQMAVLRALKKHFDPAGIMNPGGPLGLDLKGGDWRKIR